MTTAFIKAVNTAAAGSSSRNADTADTNHSGSSRQSECPPDRAVTALARLIRRDGRLASAPQFQQTRDALASDVVGESGSVIGTKGAHGCHPDKAAQRTLRIATARILCA